MDYLSVNNPVIKMYAALKTAKGRKQYGLYLAEGRKIIGDAITTNQDIQTIIIRDGVIFDTPLPQITVSERAFAKISDEETSQGVIAAIKIPNSGAKAGGSSLLLDKVSDPGNMGAILRTAAAAGVKDIYVRNTVDPYNPKCVRASMGGIFRVNIIDISSGAPGDIIKQPIICADMRGQNIFSFKPPPEYCLAVGSEASGLSKEIKALAAHTVSVPMSDGFESLNAAVAASVIIYNLKYFQGEK